MVQHELGKWNLDELAKNPNRKIIDKKLAKIESDAKKFEKIKKSLNPKISSGKFLKLLHDVEDITEKSSVIGDMHHYATLKIHNQMKRLHCLHELVNLAPTLKIAYSFLTSGGKNRLMRKMPDG